MYAKVSAGDKLWPMRREDSLFGLFPKLPLFPLFCRLEPGFLLRELFCSGDTRHQIFERTFNDTDGADDGWAEKADDEYQRMALRRGGADSLQWLFILVQGEIGHLQHVCGEERSQHVRASPRESALRLGAHCILSAP